MSETSSPVGWFAFPILCGLAGAGKSCRNLLWQHSGVRMYLKLLDDPFFDLETSVGEIGYWTTQWFKPSNNTASAEARTKSIDCGNRELHFQESQHRGLRDLFERVPTWAKSLYFVEWRCNTKIQDSGEQW